jgi:hypothetical protein
MNPQQLTQMYEEAAAMAEAGQHEPALNRMFEYLRHRPQDGQALNDAATILYCLGRGQEAIACYEKAGQFCQGDQLAQVYWNLCEAYLQEGVVGRAIGLFDGMASMGLLNADMLNRAANLLLEQDALGPAMELLQRSLQMQPEQEVLRPMVEIIRSRRAKTAIVAQRRTGITPLLADALRDQLPLTVFETETAFSADLLTGTDIALFIGCGPALAEASGRPSAATCVAILEAQDIDNSQIRAVNWRGVQMVVLCGGSDLEALFIDEVGPLPNTLHVLTAEPILNPERVVFVPRKKGKRIAAVGPWDARRNPMFAVMCFQKLNFLDPDTRLHLAGEFTDPATERYVRSMLDRLGLDSVVFLDGPVKDVKKWLKDKHYILSAALDGAGMEDVWMAMACGLRPVVHTFPGADQRLPADCLFTLAEEFCTRILNDPYDAAAHRAFAQQQFEQKGLGGVIGEMIFSVEKELLAQHRRSAPALAPAKAPPSETIPVRRLSEPSEMPHPAPRRSIGQVASDALAASRKLVELSGPGQREVDLSTSGSPGDPERPAQNDTFKYNRTEGLSVEELMEEGCGSVPFRGKR